MNVDKKESAGEPLTWADTFLLIGLLLICCVGGVVLGLYWRLLVLDHFVSTDDILSGWLLFILYSPVGVLAVAAGFIWYFALHKLFSLLGIKVTDLSKTDE